jgi:hypothetical protein
VHLKFPTCKTVGLCVIATSTLIYFFQHPFAKAESPNNTITTTMGGAYFTDFYTNKGRVEVCLPDDLSAGDTLTGSVIVVPDEKKGKREAAEDVLNGCVIEVAGEPTPVSQHKFKYVVPASQSLITLILRNSAGVQIGTTKIPVSPAPPAETSASEPTPDSYHLPTYSSSGSPAQCTGPFSGDFANTQIKVDDKPRFIYCESPRKVVFKCPSDLVGPGQIELTERGITKRGTMNGLRATIKTQYRHGTVGYTTAIYVHVDGLLGLKTPLKLKIENTNPGTFTMVGGNVQTISVPTGSSTYDYTLSANSINPGRTTFKLSWVD